MLPFYLGSNMEKVINKLKAFGWIIFGVFSICGFVQTLLTLNPRVTKLEERAGECDRRYVDVEHRVSGIEIKLDEVLRLQTQGNKDIKDLYHIILDRHAR